VIGRSSVVWVLIVDEAIAWAKAFWASFSLSNLAGDGVWGF